MKRFSRNPMGRILGILLITIVAVSGIASGKTTRKQKKQSPATIEQVKKQQKRTHNEITQTKAEIERNRKETQTRLKELNGIRRSAADNSERIRLLTAAVDSADRQIEVLNDSIADIERRVGELRDAYIRSMRAAQGERLSGSKFSFIFSATSFREAWRRMRYLGEFSNWRAERTTNLRKQVSKLHEQRTELDRIRTSRNAQLAELDNVRRELTAQNAKAENMVASLKTKGASLKELLDEKERQAQKLDAQLNRLIAAEQERVMREQREREAKERKRLAEENRKKQQKEKEQQPSPATQPSAGSTAKPSLPNPTKENEYALAAADTRRLTGDFSSNRGQLIFPVTGAYRVVRPYGRRRHPDMPNVVQDNKGVDLEVKKGATARAIFEGTVVSILREPGLNSVVMIRHGDFYTIYTNLTGLNVRLNQKVASGQTLGSIFTNPDDDNRGVIHFELRRETTTLNPLEWVR